MINLALTLIELKYVPSCYSVHILLFTDYRCLMPAYLLYYI